jgi:hypothetical protein
MSAVRSFWSKSSITPEILRSKPRRSKTSNEALERTADRRVIQLSMISILEPEAQLALVSGRSAFSR